MHDQKVVSREEWLGARNKHLAKEKEFTRLRDQLSQERQAACRNAEARAQPGKSSSFGTAAYWCFMVEPRSPSAGRRFAETRFTIGLAADPCLSISTCRRALGSQVAPRRLTKGLTGRRETLAALRGGEIQGAAVLQVI